MARVTVEDCLENVDNRFQLVMLAARRARDLTLTAADPMVELENDKMTVVALREIADEKIDPSYLDRKPEAEFSTDMVFEETGDTLEAAEENLEISDADIQEALAELAEEEPEEGDLDAQLASALAAELQNHTPISDEKKPATEADKTVEGNEEDADSSDS